MVNAVPAMFDWGENAFFAFLFFGDTSSRCCVLSNGFDKVKLHCHSAAVAAEMFVA